MPMKRDEARDDLAAYHRALIRGNTELAVRIEKKHDLFGLPPQMVSLGLEAVANGRDPWQAIEQPMERSE